MSANVTPKEFAGPDNLGIVDLTTVNSPERESPEMQRPRRSIGFYTACAIVIANIIGTGVFTSLGFQLPDIHSGFALLMLWIVGGIAAQTRRRCAATARRGNAQTGERCRYAKSTQARTSGQSRTQESMIPFRCSGRRF